jgi:hypothetical protein
MIRIPGEGVQDARALAVLEDWLSQRLDRCWRLRGSIIHPGLGGIHDVMADFDEIWVTHRARPGVSAHRR